MTVRKHGSHVVEVQQNVGKTVADTEKTSSSATGQPQLDRDSRRALRDNLRNKTNVERVPDVADGYHDIFSSRHHKGAAGYSQEDAARAMCNELNRDSKKRWEVIACPQRGWHIASGSQFFRRGW